jgi:hypothetical protein
VVFHSASSAVWRALAQAYSGAGLAVRATSVLDKLQASFKQVVSEVSVKGDPMLLLAKGQAHDSSDDTESVMHEVLGRVSSANDAEKDPQRLYSRFVSRCLELGMDVPMGAKEFYGRARKALEMAS